MDASKGWAVPYGDALKAISPRFKNPSNAALLCELFATLLGILYIGSPTAFNAFVGSFVVLPTLSYCAAILPFILTRRFSRDCQMPGSYRNGIRPGPYKMGYKVVYAVNLVSCLYILLFVVIYCFPCALLVTAISMNYACLIILAVTVYSGAY